MAGVDGNLNVTETLEQATKALAAHRAWMKRRVHNSVAPAPSSVEDLGRHEWAVKSPQTEQTPPPFVSAKSSKVKKPTFGSNKVSPEVVSSAMAVTEGEDEEVEEVSHTSHEFFSPQVNGNDDSLKNLTQDAQKNGAPFLEKYTQEMDLHGPDNKSPDVFISRGKREGSSIPSKASIMEAWGNCTSKEEEKNIARDSPIKAHQGEDEYPEKDQESVPIHGTTSTPYSLNTAGTEIDNSRSSKSDDDDDDDDISISDKSPNLIHKHFLSSSPPPYNTSYNEVEVDDNEVSKSLQESSLVRMVVVSPAPREQRTSYTAHRLTKLTKADANGKVYDFGVDPKGAEHPVSFDSQFITEGSKTECGGDLYQGIPESSVKHVLPRYDDGSEPSSGSLDSLLPLKRMLCSPEETAMGVELSESGMDKLVKPTSDDLHLQGDKTGTRVEKVTERNALPPLKLVSPYISDISLAGKRSRSPPGYEIHRPSGGLALAPPCPLYGEKQPHEEVLGDITRDLECLDVSHANRAIVTGHTRLSSPTRSSGTYASGETRKVIILKSISEESLNIESQENSTNSTAQNDKMENGINEFEYSASRLNRMSSTLILNDRNLTKASSIEPTSNEREVGNVCADDVTSIHSLVIGELPRGPGPLHLAAKSGNLRRLLSILNEVESHDIDMPDHEGRTPLMYCIHSQGVHLSCADALIRNGANLNRQTSDGASAMHLAASIGAVSVIELLLMNGASADVRDFEGRLPLHWATLQKGTKTINVLLKDSKLGLDSIDDVEMTVLMWAAYNNNPTILSYLKDQGADTEEKDRDGYTAMHWSVHKENSYCLQILLKPDMTYFKDHSGKTVMHVAAEKGSMAACEVIIKLRPEAIHDTDKMGRTPLHYAAACSRVDVSALLLDYGADASHKDSKSRTPLDYAREKKLDYVVALLSCHGSAVADFARVSRSTSLSSILDPSSQLPLLTGMRQHSNDVLDRVSSGEGELMTDDVDTTKGGYLGRFFSEGQEMVKHYYFRLNEEEGSIYWSRSCDVTFKSPRKALVLEVHEGPSNTVQHLPKFSPGDLHCYSFWIVTSGGVLDLFAYNEDAFRIWLIDLERLSTRNSLMSGSSAVKKFKSSSVHNRPPSSLSSNSLSKSSVVPFDARVMGDDVSGNLSHRSNKTDSSIFTRPSSPGVSSNSDQSTDRKLMAKNFSFSKQTQVIPTATSSSSSEHSSEKKNILNHFIGESARREVQSPYPLDVII